MPLIFFFCFCFFSSKRYYIIISWAYAVAFAFFKSACFIYHPAFIFSAPHIYIHSSYMPRHAFSCFLFDESFSVFTLYFTLYFCCAFAHWPLALRFFRHIAFPGVLFFSFSASAGLLAIACCRVKNAVRLPEGFRRVKTPPPPGPIIRYAARFDETNRADIQALARWDAWPEGMFSMYRL